MAWMRGAGDHDLLLRKVCCCWEPLLPDQQDPLNCSGPPMLFPPAMTCLLSPAAPPNCCGSAVALPSTMPSQNPPRNRSFPTESLPPLCPHGSPLQRVCGVSHSFHPRHLRQGGPSLKNPPWRLVSAVLFPSSLSAPRCSDALRCPCERMLFSRPVRCSASTSARAASGHATTMELQRDRLA